MNVAERLYVIKPERVKDANEWLLADPERFAASFGDACAAAVPWVQIRDAETIQARDEAFSLAKPLLQAPDLIQRIERAITDRGYAGDVTPAMIAYLAVTSRLLIRPINVAFVAQSSAGKTEAMDAAIALHPAEAVFRMEAGSERALIYSDESYQKRFIVVGEADSLPEDGPAASMVRSIADTNHASYDVVERDEKTSKFSVRHIEKSGPTGLGTTSTRSPKTQLGTRMFEVSIPDDPEQTRAIMVEQARRAAGKALPAVDVALFHAAQRWIALQQNEEPTIPFAESLSKLIPDTHVRFRRDQTKIFTFVKTLALLHQCQRERDSEGRIICAIDDYATVRRLLASVFDAVLSDGVTPAIRATVNAVAEGTEVSQSDLAAAMNLNKQTVSYRVNRAIQGGWLVNNEVRKGHPAKIARGTPLPEEKSALPTVEQVEQEYNRPISIAVGLSSPLPPVCPECERSDMGCRYIPEQDQWICEALLRGGTLG